MPSSDTSPKRTADVVAEEGPAQGLRTFLSLVLFIHLFCVAIALAGSFRASPLQARLARIMRPYTQLLAFDLNHSTYYSPFAAPYFLTAGHELMDANHMIEMESDPPSGEEAGALLILPEAQLRGGFAYLRYQNFARRIRLMASDEADSEEVLSLVAKSMGGAWLRQIGETKGIFRLRSHLSQPMEFDEEQGLSPEVLDPYDSRYYASSYEADIGLGADGESFVLKRSARQEVAPVDNDQPLGGGRNE